MPRISTFMYAERTEPNLNGQMTVTNPLLVINPIFVPGMFSFSIIFGVIGISNQSDHTMQILFNSPNEDEEPLVNTGVIPLAKGMAPLEKILDLPPDQKGMIFNLDFRNAVFKTEGIYKSTVLIDGEILGEFPIYVKGGEPK